MKTLSALILLLLATCALIKADEQTRSASPIQDIPEQGLAADEDDDDDDEVALDDETDDTTEQVSRENPCNKKQCQRGEDCVIRDDKPKCVCVQSCSNVNNPRHKVCGSKNTTFDSECHLDREACLCKAKSPECSNPAFKKLKLIYFGACQNLPRCDDVGMSQFPARMEGWLAIIMDVVAARNELGAYEELLTDSLHQRINAVLWKFCELDTHPQDRRVSRRELQMVIASLRPMEPCLVPFLNRCDANNDRKISLKEWGSCLGLERNEIVDKCKNLRKKARKN
ncbi:SPARC-like [Mizuhopecten yessoensis]|uniref:Acidic and cysteine-rich secreted protein n=1 Tax=Mizuhopecten yessoensis TaxID=6573 RepID=A0A210QV95_MIZYE|nr:SPARC-like [Mizuhopecten yessoensis]OWF52645.1 Acidic and cysteine-rich secreted protein [Mizuhopecten yessoensis]